MSSEFPAPSTTRENTLRITPLRLFQSLDTCNRQHLDKANSLQTGDLKLKNHRDDKHNCFITKKGAIIDGSPMQIADDFHQVCSKAQSHEERLILLDFENGARAHSRQEKQVI